MDKATAMALWERALAEEIGIILTLADPKDRHRIDKTMQDARSESGNTDLYSLCICYPGDAPNELWIVKRATDMSDLVVSR